MVTGGAGFIGSHLVRHLRGLGVKRIVIIDSLRYGDPANLGGEEKNVELVPFRLGSADSAPLQTAMKGVDYLFHLAAEKHNQSLDSPIEVLRSNVEGMHTLLQIAVDAGVKKVVFSSSLYAYGRTSGEPFDEAELPRPWTVYGISKLAGENLLTHFAQNRQLAGVALRYLFVYGPRQFAGMGYKSVIMKNGERLRDGLAPTIYGSGKQTLDYVFVDDVVDATVRAMQSNVQSEVINIGSGVPTTVSKLIDTLTTISGRKIQPEFLPPDWTEGSYRVGQVDKAERLLGWKATTAIEDGLRRTYEWMTQNSG